MMDHDPVTAEEGDDTGSKKPNGTKNKRKRSKKPSSDKSAVNVESPVDEEDEIMTVRERKAKAVILSDSDEDDSNLLTCDILTDSKMKSLSEETKESKVKLKIKNSSKKFKEKTRRPRKDSRKVSICNEIDVMNIC